MKEDPIKVIDELKIGRIILTDKGLSIIGTIQKFHYVKEEKENGPTGSD